MDSKRNRLIHHFLEASAGVQPDKCALIHGDVRVTYESLNQDANHLAQWLLDQGMITGDRVILLMENCREYLISYYAVLKAGGAVVPLNPELKPDSLGSLLDDISPRIIITSAKCERTLQALDFSADLRLTAASQFQNLQVLRRE